MATTAIENDWDDVSFIVSSQYRKVVFERLSQGPAIPSQIASDAEIEMAHVSRALGQLREREFVELLVPEDRKKGRIYGLTERGSEIWEMAKTMEAGDE